MNKDVIKILEEKLFLSSFLDEKKCDEFYQMISNYLKNRSSLETFAKNLDDLKDLYEILNIDHKSMLNSIMVWPAIIHANKQELLYKYLVSTTVVDSKGFSARKDILINHPKWFMTSLSLIYARVMFFLNEESNNVTRKNEITSRKIFRITNDDFFKSYGLTKEELIKKYPINEEGLKNILSWEENTEIYEKLKERNITK